MSSLRGPTLRKKKVSFYNLFSLFRMSYTEDYARFEMADPPCNPSENVEPGKNLLTNLGVQWESEYQTSLVFEWS